MGTSHEGQQLIDAAAKFAKQQAQHHPPQPAGVMPQPVPMSVQVGQSTGPDGKPLVMLILQTPVGQGVYFFDPDGANQIAAAITDAARVAKTGLEIPRMPLGG